jgi:tRNA (guanine-N7-)-methyltransferase
VRQHVNPLRREFKDATPAPAWGDVFAAPSLPLVVDLGCGAGRFALLLATRQAKKGVHNNVLGLEIRKPVRSFVLVAAQIME